MLHTGALVYLSSLWPLRIGEGCEARGVHGAGEGGVPAPGEPNVSGARPYWLFSVLGAFTFATVLTRALKMFLLATWRPPTYRINTGIKLYAQTLVMPDYSFYTNAYLPMTNYFVCFLFFEFVFVFLSFGLDVNFPVRVVFPVFVHDYDVIYFLIVTSVWLLFSFYLALCSIIEFTPVGFWWLLKNQHKLKTVSG